MRRSATGLLVNAYSQPAGLDIIRQPRSQFFTLPRWTPGAPFPNPIQPSITVQQTPVAWGDLQERSFVVNEHGSGSESRGVILLQAMIAVACADGHLDTAERERIMARVAELSSALAVDRTRTEARLYLGALEHKLKLPAGLATQIEQEVISLSPGEKPVQAVA